jgi:hypothetical protein
MQYLSLLTVTCVIALSVPLISAEPVLAQYRGVTLGDSLQAVVDRLQVAASDVKVVHDSPALIQQVTWRPRPFLTGSTGESESVAEMVLTFHTGRLAQITVIYDRARTQGLTNADVHEAMGSAYGPSMLVATPTTPTTGAVSAQVPIGRWEDAETLLILWREQFPNRIGLTITSIATDAALQQAIADGVRLDVAGGPARDLARRAADAAVIQARDAKIRLDNKSKFKP